MTSRLALGLRARLEQSRKRYTAAHLRIFRFRFSGQDFRPKIRLNGEPLKLGN